MSKRPAKPAAAAAPPLSIPERVLLFCVASDTDWEHAGITGTTVIVRGLIQRDPAGRLRLTKEGRAVLPALRDHRHRRHRQPCMSPQGLPLGSHAAVLQRQAVDLPQGENRHTTYSFLAKQLSDAQDALLGHRDGQGVNPQ
jgi:hypothetical protein